ncbi:MAG: DUF6159 family protein [Anaerolineales bacterium]|jgi:hypothetical protein
MIARLQNSWELVKESLNVLRADKELLIYPILSTIAALVVTVSFFVPAIFSGILGVTTTGETTGFNILSVIVGFLFYFCQFFVVTFFNTALVGAAMIRLRGGDPTVRDGFNVAFSRIGTILGYTAIGSTVGMILRSISERSRGLGRIAVGLVGMVWNLAIFLAVPILAVEGVGPLEAVKRSAILLKKTWGEQIVGNLSIGLVFGAISFGMFVVIIGGGIALSIMLENGLIMIPAVLLMILGGVLLGLLSSALNGIYSAAVYRYAAEGETGEFFSQELVQGAFRPK